MIVPKYSEAIRCKNDIKHDYWAAEREFLHKKGVIYSPERNDLKITLEGLMSLLKEYKEKGGVK